MIRTSFREQGADAIADLTATAEAQAQAHAWSFGSSLTSPATIAAASRLLLVVDRPQRAFPVRISPERGGAWSRLPWQSGPVAHASCRCAAASRPTSATHDGRVREALLLALRPEVLDELHDRGVPICVYVPCGPDWFPVLDVPLAESSGA